MTPEDLSALEALCFPGRRNWTAAAFARHLADPAGLTLHFTSAYATGRIAATEAEIISIGVHPAHRRTGVATRLLAAFEAMARTRGADQMFLEVSSRNLPAQRLYSRAGYRQVGIRKAYYVHADGTRYDASILRKALTLPVDNPPGDTPGG